MKTIIRLLAVLAVSVSTLSLPAAGRADPDVGNFRGVDAFAGFTTTDECIATSVFYIDSRGSLQVPPGPGVLGTGALVTIFQLDQCSGATLLDAIGFTKFSDFQVNAQLSSATSNATINVTDAVSGRSFEVRIHMTWNATGDLTVFPFAQHIKFPGPCNFTFHTTGRPFRPAEASGDGV